MSVWIKRFFLSLVLCSGFAFASPLESDDPEHVPTYEEWQHVYLKAELDFWSKIDTWKSQIKKLVGPNAERVPYSFRKRVLRTRVFHSNQGKLPRVRSNKNFAAQLWALSGEEMSTREQVAVARTLLESSAEGGAFEGGLIPSPLKKWIDHYLRFPSRRARLIQTYGNYLRGEGGLSEVLKPTEINTLFSETLQLLRAEHLTMPQLEELHWRIGFLSHWRTGTPELAEAVVSYMERSPRVFTKEDMDKYGMLDVEALVRLEIQHYLVELRKDPRSGEQLTPERAERIKAIPAAHWADNKSPDETALNTLQRLAQHLQQNDPTGQMDYTDPYNREPYRATYALVQSLRDLPFYFQPSTEAEYHMVLDHLLENPMIFNAFRAVWPEQFRKAVFKFNADIPFDQQSKEVVRLFNSQWRHPLLTRIILDYLDEQHLNSAQAAEVMRELLPGAKRIMSTYLRTLQPTKGMNHQLSELVSHYAKVYDVTARYSDSPVLSSALWDAEMGDLLADLAHLNEKSLFGTEQQQTERAVLARHAQILLWMASEHLTEDQARKLLFPMEMEFVNRDIYDGLTLRIFKEHPKLQLEALRGLETADDRLLGRYLGIFEELRQRQQLSPAATKRLGELLKSNARVRISAQVLAPQLDRESTLHEKVIRLSPLESLDRFTSFLTGNKRRTLGPSKKNAGPLTSKNIGVFEEVLVSFHHADRLTNIDQKETIQTVLKGSDEKGKVAQEELAKHLLRLLSRPKVMSPPFQERIRLALWLASKLELESASLRKELSEAARQWTGQPVKKISFRSKASQQVQAEELRVAALHAMVELGPEAMEAQALLGTALGDRSERVRTEALGLVNKHAEKLRTESFRNAARPFIGSLKALFARDEVSYWAEYQQHTCATRLDAAFRKVADLLN